MCQIVEIPDDEAKEGAAGSATSMDEDCVSSVTLSTGREVVLEEFNQRLTYEGLVAGLPTTGLK